MEEKFKYKKLILEFIYITISSPTVCIRMWMCNMGGRVKSSNSKDLKLNAMLFRICFSLNALLFAFKQIYVWMPIQYTTGRAHIYVNAKHCIYLQGYGEVLLVILELFSFSKLLQIPTWITINSVIWMRGVSVYSTRNMTEWFVLGLGLYMNWWYE